MNINIKKNNMTMNLQFEGNLKMLENDKNEMLFQFNNSDVFINAFLQPNAENIPFDSAVDELLKVLKSADYTTSKYDVLKTKLGNLSDVKTEYKKIKTNFKNSAVLLLEKNDVKQLQFLVEIKSGILIIGLIMLKEELNLQNTATRDAAKKIVKSINTIIEN